MLAGLKQIFRHFEESDDPHAERDETRIAAAALLVETALLDGRFDEKERQAIVAALRRGFGINEAEALALVSKGEQRDEEANELYTFTRTLKDSMSPDERVKIIEMLWEVSYADGRVHAYEANLVRRVAGLLFVPDRDSGLARKRVKARLGIGD